MQHFLIVPIGMVPLFPGGAGIDELGFGGLYVREIVRERSIYAVLVTPCLPPPTNPPIWDI
jgi:hypothetical protein